MGIHHEKRVYKYFVLRWQWSFRSSKSQFAWTDQWRPQEFPGPDSEWVPHRMQIQSITVEATRTLRTFTSEATCPITFY